MAKSKHKPYHHQIQDQDHQNDQLQDQRPRLRRNTPPRIFGTSRQPEDEPPPALIGWDGLARKGIQYHPNHLRRLWEAGKFPKPIKISERRLAWPSDEIDAWISAKIAENA